MGVYKSKQSIIHVEVDRCIHWAIGSRLQFKVFRLNVSLLKDKFCRQRSNFDNFICQDLIFEFCFNRVHSSKIYSTINFEMKWIGFSNLLASLSPVILPVLENENWRNGKCSLKYHPFWSWANNLSSPKVNTPQQCDPIEPFYCSLGDFVEDWATFSKPKCFHSGPNLLHLHYGVFRGNLAWSDNELNIFSLLKRGSVWRTTYNDTPSSLHYLMCCTQYSIKFNTYEVFLSVWNATAYCVKLNRVNAS